MELHHITLSGETQGRGSHRQPPQDQNVSTVLPRLLIVGTMVEEIPLRRAEIVPPLLLDVDKCPLPSVEGKVLKTGQLEEVLLTVAAHTPSITSASNPSRGMRRML